MVILMIKIDYLNHNKKYKNDVIKNLKEWNNKSFDNKDITV